MFEVLLVPAAVHPGGPVTVGVPFVETVRTSTSPAATPAGFVNAWVLWPPELAVDVELPTVMAPPPLVIGDASVQFSEVTRYTGFATVPQFTSDVDPSVGAVCCR